MARVKRAVNAKKSRRQVLERAKGYYGNKSRSVRAANEQVMRSGQYAFRDRKVKKRTFRMLWQARINAAARASGITSSRFIEGLTKVFYPEASSIVVFVIMAIVLMIRPAGLFGKEL